jgi:hypothetical protein
MSRSENFNEGAFNARPLSDTPQVVTPAQKQAWDKDTGKQLSPEAAQSARDNPMMHKWVEWR